MCIYVPADHPQRDALGAFNAAQCSMMARALSKWTEEDWARVEREIAEDEAREADEQRRLINVR